MGLQVSINNQITWGKRGSTEQTISRSFIVALLPTLCHFTQFPIGQWVHPSHLVANREPNGIGHCLRDLVSVYLRNLLYLIVHGSKSLLTIGYQRSRGVFSAGVSQGLLTSCSFLHLSLWTRFFLIFFTVYISYVLYRNPYFMAHGIESHYAVWRTR